VRNSEAVIELMYQAQLKPWWMLQPDLQYVINPGGAFLILMAAFEGTLWSSASAHC
jgi:carbohydrate-selective porin OprB